MLTNSPKHKKSFFQAQSYRRAAPHRTPRPYFIPPGQGMSNNQTFPDSFPNISLFSSNIGHLRLLLRQADIYVLNAMFRHSFTKA